MSSDNLLTILNSIADLAIGNEQPVDAGFNDRTTLPELLAHAMFYPTDRENIVAAERKLEELLKVVNLLKHELFVMKKTIDIKRKC
jgi:hypothetical protein